jgi:hypothetical protein
VNETSIHFNARKIRTLPQTALYILWGLMLAWGVIYANNMVYPAILKQFPTVHSFLNDIYSDSVFLFAAFLPVILTPRFFGYQFAGMGRHWKILLGMAIFFTGAPLVYRMFLGETPFGANTWFFEGFIVPVAEEGFFRGVLLSVLLWGFEKIYTFSVL